MTQSDLAHSASAMIVRLTTGQPTNMSNESQELLRQVGLGVHFHRYSQPMSQPTHMLRGTHGGHLRCSARTNLQRRTCSAGRTELRPGVSPVQTVQTVDRGRDAIAVILGVTNGNDQRVSSQSFNICDYLRYSRRSNVIGTLNLHVPPTLSTLPCRRSAGTRSSF